MKKAFSIFASALLLLTLSGCLNGDFLLANDITVISREEGSGTRSAFIELFGIEQKDAAGNKTDYTVDMAEISDSTGVMLANAAQNQNAIGYISLGSMSGTVKALKIDGVEPTAENIKNGTYKIFRPFNIVTKGVPSGISADFISFILSAEGQAVVASNGYIPFSGAEAYSGAKPSGKIVIAGSSSVSPVMEKLKEAYLAVNTNAAIEIQESDSTTGINSTAEGICDIGLASRELKDSEVQKGLSATVIATDGLAVIVNLKNTFDTLTVGQVKNIYTGVCLKWSDV